MLMWLSPRCIHFVDSVVDSANVPTVPWLCNIAYVCPHAASPGPAFSYISCVNILIESLSPFYGRAARPEDVFIFRLVTSHAINYDWWLNTTPVVPRSFGASEFVRHVNNLIFTILLASKIHPWYHGDDLKNSGKMFLFPLLIIRADSDWPLNLMTQTTYSPPSSEANASAIDSNIKFTFHTLPSPCTAAVQCIHVYIKTLKHITLLPAFTKCSLLGRLSQYHSWPIAIAKT